MRYTFLLILLFSIILASCQSSTVVTKDMTPTPTQIVEVKKDNINFELTSLNITYDDNTEPDSQYIVENFDGTGIITATGDESLVKMPYDVLIEIKKISGGSKRSSNEGLRVIVVNNGIGTFTTYDSIYEKNATRMLKPVYEIKIIGYSPFIMVEPKIAPKG